MSLVDFAPKNPKDKPILYVDVKEKITEFLKSQLRKCKNREIDWDKLRAYCIELGEDRTHLLCVPISVIDECIEGARDELKL